MDKKDIERRLEAAEKQNLGLLDEIKNLKAKLAEMQSEPEIPDFPEFERGSNYWAVDDEFELQKSHHSGYAGKKGNKNVIGGKQMTIDSAIQHLKDELSSPAHDWGCEECKAEHEQLLAFLQDLKKYRETFGNVKNTKFCIPECEEGYEKIADQYERENSELKRLLRLAVDDLKTALFNCEEDMLCDVCGYKESCNCMNYCHSDFELRKWRYYDEAMKLLGGTENAEI